LQFNVKLDVQLFLEGVDAQFIRLVARARFRTPDGSWTRTRDAIIDPGSPNCIIPHSVWSTAEHQILVSRPMRLGGIGGGSTAAPLGQVILVVHDDVATSPPLAIRAFLLPDDSEPLLLGFEDFLTQVVLHCDYPQHEAYLEFRPG
jgi:hypothetical protein